MTELERRTSLIARTFFVCPPMDKSLEATNTMNTINASQWAKIWAQTNDHVKDISLYEINESEEDEIWQDGISEDDVGSSNINSRISSKRSFGSYKFERTVGAFSVMSPEEGLSMINPAQTDWIILEAHNGLIRDFDDSAAAALLRKPKTVVSSPKNLLRNSRSNSIGSRGPTMLAEGSHGIQPSFSKERTDTEAKSSHGDLLAKKQKSSHTLSDLLLDITKKIDENEKRTSNSEKNNQDSRDSGWSSGIEEHKKLQQGDAVKNAKDLPTIEKMIESEALSDSSSKGRMDYKNADRDISIGERESTVSRPTEELTAVDFIHQMMESRARTIALIYEKPRRRIPQYFQSPKMSRNRSETVHSNSSTPKFVNRFQLGGSSGSNAQPDDVPEVLQQLEPTTYIVSMGGSDIRGSIEALHAAWSVASTKDRIIIFHCQNRVELRPSIQNDGGRRQSNISIGDRFLQVVQDTCKILCHQKKINFRTIIMQSVGEKDNVCTTQFQIENFIDSCKEKGDGNYILVIGSGSPKDELGKVAKYVVENIKNNMIICKPPDFLGDRLPVVEFERQTRIRAVWDNVEYFDLDRPVEDFLPLLPAAKRVRRHHIYLLPPEYTVKETINHLKTYSLHSVVVHSKEFFDYMDLVSVLAEMNTPEDAITRIIEIREQRVDQFANRSRRSRCTLLDCSTPMREILRLICERPEEDIMETRRIVIYKDDSIIRFIGASDILDIMCCFKPQIKILKTKKYVMPAAHCPEGHMVEAQEPVLNAIKNMHDNALTIVPVVEDDGGRQSILGSISTSDFRRIIMNPECLSLNCGDFISLVSQEIRTETSSFDKSRYPVISCRADSGLYVVTQKLLSTRVQRVYLVDPLPGTRSSSLPWIGPSSPRSHSSMSRSSAIPRTSSAYTSVHNSPRPSDANVFERVGSEIKATLELVGSTLSLQSITGYPEGGTSSRHRLSSLLLNGRGPAGDHGMVPWFGSAVPCGIISARDVLRYIYHEILEEDLQRRRRSECWNWMNTLIPYVQKICNQSKNSNTRWDAIQQKSKISRARAKVHWADNDENGTLVEIIKDKVYYQQLAEARKQDHPRERSPPQDTIRPKVRVSHRRAG